jgi:acetyltransferase-like isoleucine patch superfamily enzyme
MIKKELIKKFNLSKIQILKSKIIYFLANSKMFNLFFDSSKLYSMGNLRLQAFFAENFFNFPVGPYSYGFNQFCKPGINLQSIGAFCSIGANVSITSLNHPTSCITTSPILYKKNFFGFHGKEQKNLINTEKNKKVLIGNDVWIGENVTILPSVKIGNGAIIGAGSIVTKDVPDYAVVVGNPAHILKSRFTEEQIRILNKIQWWNWPEEKISKNIELLSNPTLFFETFQN